MPASIARVRDAKNGMPILCQPGDLPMWVADWDFQCADPIVDAVKSRAAHPCYGYPCGDPKDKEAFCGYWQRGISVTIQPEQTQMLPCVVTGCGRRC